MSTPTIKVKVFPKAVVKGKMDVRFPANVAVLSPILLDRSNGTFTFSFDMDAVTETIGLNFQPLDSDLTAIAALSTTAYGRSLLTLANATALASEVDSFFLTPAEGNAAYQPLDSDLTAIAALTTTSYGRAFLALADAAAARTAIGAGTISTQNSNNVTITGGSISGITDLAIADGGTGASTAGAAFDALAPTTTRGDLIFRNATTNARLAASTAGYFLQTNGAGTDPTYAGFLQPGTSAVTRTWQARNQDYFSVKDFGAVGDDSTNDTSAINAAVAAAAAATPQRAVYFPAGTYRVTSLSNIPANIALVGENRKTSIIRTTSATADVITLDGSNAQVRSLQVDASVARTTGYFIKLTNNGQRVTVENVNLVAPFWGIYIPSTIALVTLRDIDISSTVATSGVSIVVDGGYAIEMDNVICRNSTGFAHLQINHVEDITLTNCQFLQTTYPLIVQCGNSQHLGMMLASNTMFDAPIGQAIRLAPTGTGVVNRIFINNAWISQASGGSNVLITNAGGGSVNGVSIENSIFTGATNGIGAELVGVSNIHLRGNRIGAHTTGISASNCTNLVITGNRIGATDGYATNTTGISLSGTTDYAYVVANDINGNGTEISNTASGTHNIIALSGDATSVGLNAVAGLTPAADRLPYFTGARTAALATFTAAGRALIDDADAAAQRVTLGIRDVLSANRTYYVLNAGSDSNTGLVNSAGGAFATLQKAYNTILTLDLNGFTASIVYGTSGQTITSGLSLTSPPVGGNVTIDLGGSTLSTTSATAIYFATTAKITIKNGTISTTTSGHCINAAGNGASVTLSTGLTFGACANAHMRIETGATLECTSAYSITGAAANHYQCLNGGRIVVSSFTVTLSGTLAFTTFADFSYTGFMSAFGMTYTGGTITGTRYTVTLNGVINTFGGGANVFPGNVAGSTATGGQYA